LTYLYIPIRSLQGYGDITSLGAFLTYITGGDFGATIGMYGAQTALGVLADYFKIIYYSYPAAIIVTAFAGLFYLFKKDKFLATLLVFCGLF
jgi:hypothetical protein